MIPDCEARYFINGVDYDIDHPNARYATSGAPAAPSNGTNIGCFIDIDKHCKVFDFYRALHLGSAESVIYFGSLIKDRYPNKLTGASTARPARQKFSPLDKSAVSIQF